MGLKDYTTTLFTILISGIITSVFSYQKGDLFWIWVILGVGILIITTAFISWLQDRTKRVQRNTKQTKSNKKRLQKLEEQFSMMAILHKHDKEISILKEKINWCSTNGKVFKSKK